MTRRKPRNDSLHWKPEIPEWDGNGKVDFRCVFYEIQGKEEFMRILVTIGFSETYTDLP